MPRAPQGPKPYPYGRYKLGVTFLQHQAAKGNPFYFRSTKRQDAQGKSIGRLRWLIEEKWAGRVAWACIYENDQPLIEFHHHDNEWRDASDKQTGGTSPAADPQGEAHHR